MYVWLKLSVILKINIATGYVSPYAGTYTAGTVNSNVPANLSPVNGTGSLAVDTAGNVYFTSPNVNQVYVINYATYRITLIAGVSSAGSFRGDGSQATSANFNLYSWSGLTYSSMTNALYISDSNNRRVRKISLMTRIITTFAGTGTAGCDGDGSQATAALINYPSGLAVDSVGNIFIADWGGNSIRKVTTAGIISTVAGIVLYCT